MSYLVVLVLVAITITLSWVYFLEFRINRPALGVFNLYDIIAIMGFVIITPYLYMVVPLWFVAGLIFLSSLALLYFTLENILPSRYMVWTVLLLLGGLDVAAQYIWGGDNDLYLAINNLILLLLVVGLTNLWVQGGIKARDVAVLGMALALYDFIATWQLGVTSEVFGRLWQLPLTPMLAWDRASGQGLGIGLVDLLLFSLFPLVTLKAFSQLANLLANLITFGAVAIISLLPIPGMFPTMIVLGPLMAAQYLFWVRRYGREKTTREWLNRYRVTETRNSGAVL